MKLTEKEIGREAKRSFWNEYRIVKAFFQEDVWVGNSIIPANYDDWELKPLEKKPSERINEILIEWNRVSPSSPLRPITDAIINFLDEEPWKK